MTEAVVDDVIQFDTNIDDMDPRLWPGVLETLLVAGARDAWATPIIMKKGRPAFTLSALCTSEAADAVLDAIFRETTTIGVRETSLRRHALERQMVSVEVRGHQIGVKVARREGTVVNHSIEWDDVVATADSLGLPAKEVLALATAASEPIDQLVRPDSSETVENYRVVLTPEGRVGDR